MVIFYCIELLKILKAIALRTFMAVWDTLEIAFIEPLACTQMQFDSIRWQYRCCFHMQSIKLIRFDFVSALSAF